MPKEPLIEQKGCISTNPLIGDPVMLFETVNPETGEREPFGYRESEIRGLLTEGDWSEAPVAKAAFEEAIRLLEATKQFLRNPNGHPEANFGS